MPRQFVLQSEFLPGSHHDGGFALHRLVMSPHLVVRQIRQNYRVIEARAGGGGGGGAFFTVDWPLLLTTTNSCCHRLLLFSYVQVEALGLALELVLPCVAMVRII